MGGPLRDTPRGTTFERCALVSGLLTKEQLTEARAAVGQASGVPPGLRFAPTDEQLAEQMVKVGWLNFWQAQQLLAGRTKFNLGPYWIVDSLGRGGMGQVFKGQHALLNRVVAIKVLPRQKSTPEAIANFTNEIRAQAKLDHESLVRALDAGQDGNVHYLVTEYVPGMDLRKMVRASGPLSMEAAANVISQVAAALEHAHEQGLVHRDVKPGNILVTPDGRAKLSDLGLAGSLEEVEGDPRFGRIVGTADYLAPDHIESPSNPTPSWDIYSLGCTLYYAVTGKVPFPGGTTADKARAHCQLRPLDPRRLNPLLSGDFVDVMADMMAKKPAERIPSAARVIERLKPWTTGGWAPPGPRASRSAAYADEGLPPGLGGASETPHGADMALLKDTATGFPDLPEPAPPAKDASSDASQPTYPVAAAGEETRSIPDLPRQPVADPGTLLRPALFLLLLPVGVVVLTTVLWAILRLL